MTSYCVEYIWIDGFNTLRSKTKMLTVEHGHYYPKELLKILPEWNFDGSSTGQAEGKKSDIILKPVYVVLDPFREDKTPGEYFGFLALCETFNADGTPHVTNKRAKCKETYELAESFEPLFGIEQEYIIYNNDFPYKWHNNGIVKYTETGITYVKQGPYYCGAGGNVAFGREIAEKHLQYCNKIDMSICGINAEVTPSQWEFQIGPINGLELADQLWIARYILNRIAEEYNCWINYHPKPLEQFNGSGLHTNFSTNKMRESYDYIIEACEKLSTRHEEHLEIYGNPEENKMRLTGAHETACFNKFSYGVSDRGASVRIPLNVFNEKKGYIEDRRPPSNADPYMIVEKILNTVCLE